MRTYQADEDAEELNDIRVRNCVEATEESVENCDARTQDDARLVVHVDNNAESGA